MATSNFYIAACKTLKPALIGLQIGAGLLLTDVHALKKAFHHLSYNHTV